MRGGAPPNAILCRNSPSFASPARTTRTETENDSPVVVTSPFRSHPPTSDGLRIPLMGSGRGAGGNGAL
eukprot:4725384-Pyramimonas_sp.AAC.1